MKCSSTNTGLRMLILGVCLVAAGTCQAALTELYFRAATVTNTMADGRTVLMWGFAQDSGPGSQDGAVTVPGPAIALDAGAQDLLIHLTNELPEPVSIVVPGLASSIGDPVRNGDGRARSFTHEAAPGGGADFLWTNVQAGTHVYHSGSHPALQVQMGLYGALTKLEAADEAYPGVPIDQDITLFFSEIDPDLHDAVASNDYGPGLGVTSTLKYAPRYFMINGVSYTNGLPPIHVGIAGSRVLLRMINAGIDYHIPMINDALFSLVAENGQPVAYPRDTYATTIAPLNTADGVFTPAASNVYALFDRRLGLYNGANEPGGMLRHLLVAPAPPPGPAFVDITNAAPQSVLTASVDIFGTNSIYTAALWVSNAAAGGVAAAFAWGDPVALVPGLNTIAVYGSNIAGDVASDTHDVTYIAPPFVDITNADFVVASGVSSVTIGGTSLYCAGSLVHECYSNSIAGIMTDSGSVPAAASWQATISNLVYGLNVITVAGTNSVGAESVDTLLVTRLTPVNPYDVEQFSINMDGGVINLTWSNGTVGVLACTNRYFSSNAADWLVLAQGVTSPWTDLESTNYPAVYYLIASGPYTSAYAVGAYTMKIKQSDGVTFGENWVSCPFDLLDASGNTVAFKSFDEIGVAACLTDQAGFLNQRDRVQAQEPIGGNTFTASRGSNTWFMDSPIATNWYANKMYSILVNPLHTGPDKPLTFVGKVRNDPAHTVGGIVQSDGVTFRENWVAYPYPYEASFDQGAVASVLTDQAGFLINRDRVQSQEPVGGNTFTASRGLGAWFYDAASATNLQAGKGYIIYINPLHTGATTNWNVPKPY